MVYMAVDDKENKMMLSYILKKRTPPWLCCPNVVRQKQETTKILRQIQSLCKIQIVLDMENSALTEIRWKI